MKPKAKKLKVLAVDDQPANLIALEAVLSGEYELVFAASGQQAIEVLELRQDFAVILMDLQMPGIDGFETVQRIKSLENCRDIPIIFITAIYKEEPFVKKGYELGAVDYFSKPFDPEILKMKVAIYASYRQKTDLLKERDRQLKETEELLQTGRRLASVLESLPVGVLIVDNEGRICQINEVVSRICGVTEPTERDAYGEILGWWDSKGQMIKNHGGPLARAIHHGEVSHNKLVEIERADGGSTTALSSASPLLGLDGKIVGAVVVIQDVSETKKIEERLEEKIAKFVSLGVELGQSAH